MTRPLALPVFAFLSALSLPTGAQCEQQKLHVLSGVPIVCDVDGDTAVVRHGAVVRILEHTPFGWVAAQVIDLPPPSAGVWFGEADLDGDRLAIGCFDLAQEMVLVYERSGPGAAFAQTAVVTPSVPGDHAMFGERVALSGDVLAVGASDVLGTQGRGRAFVFEHAGGAWTEVLALQGGGVAELGTALGNDVAIGALGGGPAVFVAELGGGPHATPGGIRALVNGGAGWTEAQIFGRGAKLDADGGNVAEIHAGFVYVYEPLAGAWSETAAVPLAAFASDVAISGPRLAVRQPGDELGGAVLLIERSGATWSPGPTLTPADGHPGAQFGLSLDLDGDVLVASAPFDADAPGETGALYAFSVSGTGCPSLTADVHAIPSATGGVQTLALRPGGAFAGEPYVLAGSLSGFWPGTALAGATIPLNLDPYLAYSLSHGGSPIASAPVGLLDANGEAVLQLALPPDPSLSGLLAHHAFGVLGPGLSVAHVSNPVPLLMP